MQTTLSPLVWASFLLLAAIMVFGAAAPVLSVAAQIVA
jgi:hypothetical protein